MPTSIAPSSSSLLAAAKLEEQAAAGRSSSSKEEESRGRGFPESLPGPLKKVVDAVVAGTAGRLTTDE